MTKSFQPISIGLFITLWLAIPSSHGFDLLDAWQAAKRHDSSFAADQAQWQAGQEKEVQGLAGLLPQVGIKADTTQSRLSTYSPESNTDGYARSIGVAVKQSILDLSAYYRYKMGKTATEISNNQFASAQQDFMLKVANAYFAVLLAQDDLASTLAAKTAYERQLAQAKKSFEVGTATITDTYEAQASYDAAIAKQIINESELDIKRRQLSMLTGLNAATIAPLSQNLTPSPLSDKQRQTWTADALSQNLLIKQAQENAQLAQEDLKLAKSANWPTISLEANYGDKHQTGIANEYLGYQRNHSRGSSLSLNLSMPLYAGGGIQSSIREKAALADKAQQQLETAKRITTEEVNRTFLGVSNGAALVRANEQLVKTAKSKLDATRLGQEVGIRSNLDVLQAEKDYQAAIRELANSRYNYLLSKLALAKATGTLDQEDLVEVNRYLR